MRGKDGNSHSIELALAELYGGIRQNIINFSAETGVSAGWVAARVSELLSPERQGVLHHLSTMQSETTGNGRAVEPLALAVHAHSGETPTATETKRETSNHAEGKVAKKSWFKNLSPKQVQEMNLKRLKKRTDEMGMRMYKGMLNKLKGKPRRKSPSDDPAKRRIYSQRYAAKKKGLPVPPLQNSQTSI